MGAADNFFLKAEQALKKRNFDYAIELYQQGLRIDPDRIEERRKLRASSIRRCQQNGGNTMGGKAFKLRHGLKLGGVKKLSLQKKWEEQIIDLEKLLTIAPQNPDLLSSLGNAFVLTDRIESAIQSYTELVDIDRSNSEAWKSLARLYEKKKDIDKAVQCWEKVRETRPEDQQAGKAIRDLSAATMMRKAEERRSGGEGSFRDLLKDVDEAAKLEKKAAIVRTSDDARTAIDLKLEDIQKDQASPRLQRELGDLYMKIKDFDSSRRAYEKSKELDPQDLYAEEKLGTLNERIIESRIDDARLSVQGSPEDADAQNELEAALQAQNEFLLVELPRRVAAHPTDYGLKYRHGKFLFENGRFNEAIGLFQNSRKDPKFATDSHYMIGQSFFAKKLYDLSIKEYSSALSGIPDPDSELAKNVNYNLAKAYEEKKEFEKALEIYEGIMALDISFRDVSKKVDEIRGM